MEHVSTVVNRVLDDAGICTQCYKVPCQCDALYEQHLDNQMFPPPNEDLDDGEAYEPEDEELELDEEDEEEEEDWLDEDEEWDEEED